MWTTFIQLNCFRKNICLYLMTNLKVHIFWWPSSNDLKNKYVHFIKQIILFQDKLHVYVGTKFFSTLQNPNFFEFVKYTWSNGCWCSHVTCWKKMPIIEEININCYSRKGVKIAFCKVDLEHKLLIKVCSLV